MENGLLFLHWNFHSNAHDVPESIKVLGDRCLKWVLLLVGLLFTFPPVKVIPKNGIIFAKYLFKVDTKHPHLLFTGEQNDMIPIRLPESPEGEGENRGEGGFQ